MWTFMQKKINTLVVAMMLAGLGGCGVSQQSQNQTSSQKTIIPGIKFIEQVDAQPGKTIIAYQKYQLANGLTVLIHEDHSDPLVHLDVTYHVGSGREGPGKSGFAHFFEHMMFQGSEHVGDEEHFKRVTEAGGNMNGSTNTDRTNYYQTVPANYIEEMLWLEADRMGYLVDAVTQEKFEVQRETVKNERGQQVDNRPYGRVDERISQALYPLDHPYSWPVIGFMEDLDRVNVNDLKKFFLRWYGPNNATLTIGGAVDPQNVLSLVNKYFGTIPRGPEVLMPVKQPAVVSEDRYISMEDNVHLPLVYLSFPTVSARHKDEAPLDILSQILGGGKTSLLYKNLVKNQLAVQASVSHPCIELACRFNMLALPHPASGKNLADLEKIIRDSIDEFEQRGVEEDDLTKVKAAMEANFVFGLQSVAGKVSTLASNQTFTGNPNYIEQDIARYNNVTKADVMRVFKKYIKGQHSVIMSVVPQGQLDKVAHADTFVPPARQFDKHLTITADNLEVRRAPSTFDRSKAPIAGKAVFTKVPDFWRKTLSNGIRILGSQSTETPTTSLLLKIPAGHFYESVNKTGLSTLLVGVLDEGTLKHTGEQMSQMLEKLGSSIAIEPGNSYVNISVSSLSQHLPATLKILQEKLFEPAFAPADFERVKKQAVQSILNGKKSADYLARRAFSELMFGKTIAGSPRGGTVESVSSLVVDDIKGFYNNHFKPSGAQMIVVSDLSQAQLTDSLSGFERWQGKAPELALSLPEPNQDKPLTIYLVNKDKAAQSSIRLGKRGLKMDITGEYYRTNLANFPLGGNFNSRINLNLREEKGYTYGASSGFWGDKFAGGFTAGTSVRADVTDKSIIELVKEIKTYREQGINAAELAFMRKSINQKDVLRYETPAAKLRFLAQILEHDLQPEFVAQRSKIVDSISAKEINALNQKHLNIDDMLMVVVGDAATLRPKLEALGYKVEDYQL
ncbi:MAG: zinc protease [Alteromonadaceae bacterium]|jgi:zinc protease